MYRQYTQQQQLTAALLPTHGAGNQSRKEKTMPFPINQNIRRKYKAHFPRSLLVPAITHNQLHLFMTQSEKTLIQPRNLTEESGIF